MNRYSRRKLGNVVALAAASVATAIGLFFLGAILWVLFSRGFAALGPALFTQMTPPPGESGGLLNAIYGSAVMTFVGVLIGTPIGLMAGTYLAEYGRSSRLASTVRFVNDILLSAPSIIIGLFVYELIVARAGHFSAWAGAVALGVIVIPVVLRTTEDMLRLVPDGMRESALALGAQRSQMILSVIYPAARSGLVTGALLAVARVSGETAPLLFTALNNQFWSTNMNAPMANLPVVIFQFALSPYNDWRDLAWGGALLVTLSILLLNIVARALASRGMSKGGH